MEVRIGIKDSGREISLESPLDSKGVQAAIKQGMSDGTIELTDNKGKLFIVPASSVAFVEIGSEDSRRVGFIS
ncbi:MAG: DUF3107 family protein [Actinobacteria bacterium]|uniref:Unannotated protein n=1 Tax=freshwater metagenome TaxID=449393 RepID=A0A6J6EDX9_9ZZZZ|nr:DUF3107 family protein [Actinomycetota bacterium]MTA90198.1 DUF3107 family protein [Actinomycetota bacterium]